MDVQDACLFGSPPLSFSRSPDLELEASRNDGLRVCVCFLVWFLVFMDRVYLVSWLLVYTESGDFHGLVGDFHRETDMVRGIFSPSEIITQRKYASLLV